VINSQFIHISGRLVAAIEAQDGRLLLFRYRDASSGNQSWTLVDIVQSNFPGADADSGYASVHCTTVHDPQEIRVALDGGTRGEHWHALLQAGAANDPDLAALWVRHRGVRDHRPAGDKAAAPRRQPFTSPDPPRIEDYLAAGREAR